MLRNSESYIMMPDGSNSNFKYKEFIKSDTALRLGINNEPGEVEWVCIEKLVQNIIQPVRLKFGPIRITSGFRSAELCLKIGSSINSNHTRGQAADFEPLNDSVTLISIAEWIYINCEFRELICEYFPSGWCHCAYRENGNTKTVKLKDKTHNYTRISISEIKNIYS
ncbi:peptidase M15 [Candidatus Pacearchaeota archaeon]|nr:peptidase M15 [Candidatus Pacearchaeota archaeon]